MTTELAVVPVLVRREGPGREVLARRRAGRPLLLSSTSVVPGDTDTLERWSSVLGGAIAAQGARVIAEVPPEPFRSILSDGCDVLLWCRTERVAAAPVATEWIPLIELVEAIDDPQRSQLLLRLATATFDAPELGERAIDTAVAWADAHLDGGHSHRSPWHVRRVRPYSAILQCLTPTGSAVLKLAAGMFNNDGAVVSALPALTSLATPNVLAADGPGNATLLEHVDGGALAEVGDARSWAATFEAFDLLQRTLASESARQPVSETLRIPTYQPVDQVDLEAMLAGASAWLTVEAQQEISTRLADVRGWLARFDALGLPLTIDHGDLHANNVICHGTRSLLLDWTDTSVGPPLLWLATAMAAHREARPSLDDRVWRGIVDHWTGGTERPDIVRRAAFVAGCVHQARHYRWIAEGLGPLYGAQFAAGVGFWLDQAAATARSE